MNQTNGQNYIPDIARAICKDILEELQTRVISVLLYGSSITDQKYWDLDILIILDANKLDLEVIDKLKKIAEGYKDVVLDLQFMYQKEFFSPDFLSLDAHGSFFSRILKRAAPLHGTNPFLNFEPSRKQLIISLVTRIQRYLFHARQEYILGGRHNKDRNPQYHQKHVIRAMFDLLLINQEWVESDQVLPAMRQRYGEKFTEEEWDVVSSHSDAVADYLVLYEKIYDLALEEGLKYLK